MTYKKKITILYRELLGQELQQIMTERKKIHSEIMVGDKETDEDTDKNKKGGEVSAATISQVLSGKRNMTNETALAFQISLDFKNPKEVFFPSRQFINKLIEEIVVLIKSDDIFSKSMMKKYLTDESFIISETLKKQLANSLYDFFEEFTVEETSNEVGESITEWLSEMSSIITKPYVEIFHQS